MTFVTNPSEGTAGNLQPVRYAVLSDIHANLEALTAVLQDASEQRCNAYACVGDIVGYNANPRECIELVRAREMTCVQGNHDEYCATSRPLENLNPRAAAAVRWTREQLPESDKHWLRESRYRRTVAGFSLVHASLDEPQQWGYVFDKYSAAASLVYQTTAVCFFGHTHVPMVFIRDHCVRCEAFSKFNVEPGRKYFVNVGSVGEPRDGDTRAAYAIYDLAASSIELRRVDFDFEQTVAKVQAAGLPPRARR